MCLVCKKCIYQPSTIGKKDKIVVCFYLEWFRSQICPQQVFLTSISLCRLELHNGVFSLQCTSGDPMAILEDNSRLGLFLGSLLPCWLFSGGPEGTGTWLLLTYYFRLSGCFFPLNLYCGGFY